MAKSIDLMLILNRQVMADLLGDDKQMIQQFERDFVAQAKSIVAEMIALIKLKQFVQLKAKAHYLKTSAKAIGAEQSAFWLQQIEHDCNEQHFEHCQTSLKSLMLTLQQVEKEVQLDC